VSVETVTNCPMCGSTERRALHADVPDFVFHASDEHWAIAQCASCESLYLSERPDMASIGRYYDRYYTHSTAPDSAPISGIAVQSSWLKRLANSWRNARYGTNRPSLGPLGAVALVVAWPLRQWVHAECRHLPPHQTGRRRPRVLDVGFGDGRFLRFAAEAGWDAQGMEIDPKAVAAAQANGLQVHQGDISAALARFGSDSFDYITMSHVIEHVHHPHDVLAAARALLRAGGTLWVETPNPESFGHQVFGARWRDLDPPRHLCLSTRHALISAAARNGLPLEAEHHRPFVPFEVFPFSAAACGTPYRGTRGTLQCAGYELLSLLRPQRREWLTLSFKRPLSDTSAHHP